MTAFNFTLPLTRKRDTTKGPDGSRLTNPETPTMEQKSDVIENPLAALLAGRQLEALSAAETKELAATMLERLNAAQVDVEEARKKTHTDMLAGAGSISLAGLERAKTVHEIMSSTLGMVDQAVVAAEQRESAAEKQARRERLEEALETQRKAAVKLQKALDAAGAAFNDVCDCMRTTMRTSGMKMESTIVEQLRPSHIKHLAEIHLFNVSSGEWQYKNVPVYGHRPDFARLVENIGGDILDYFDLKP